MRTNKLSHFFIMIIFVFCVHNLVLLSSTSSICTLHSAEIMMDGKYHTCRILFNSQQCHLVFLFLFPIFLLIALRQHHVRNSKCSDVFSEKHCTAETVCVWWQEWNSYLKSQTDYRGLLETKNTDLCWNSNVIKSSQSLVCFSHPSLPLQSPVGGGGGS